MTLSSCVEQLTSTEIADPANFVRTLCLHVLTEIAACPNPTLKALTDDRLEDFAALLAEIWTERPNIKKASILAHRLVDSIEMHTTAFEDESKTRVKHTSLDGDRTVVGSAEEQAMNFSEQVRHEGLFLYTSRKIRERRASYEVQQGGRWFAAPEGKNAQRVVPARQSEDAPIQKIVPTTIDAVDEVDAQLVELLKDDIEEVGAPVVLVAGEDEPVQ